MFDVRAQQKNIDLVYENQLTHMDIMLDETKLREVLLNVLSNAMKYTASGGKVTMTQRELPYDKEGYVLYETIVKDTGIGMSPDFLPHLFDEFARERTSTESKIGGTGLGMPIVKRLVTMMNGTIQVESRQGEGTTITLRIPHRIATAEAATPREQREEMVSAADFSGKHLLLAEDNELNAEIAMTILQEEGFVVDWAQDGVLCVDRITKAAPGTYDAILMDIQMPNMDGYKAAKLIRSLPQPEKARIPIIAMTANAFEEDKQTAFDVGMNAHVAKPIQIDKLNKALWQVLME